MRQILPYLCCLAILVPALALTTEPGRQPADHKDRTQWEYRTFSTYTRLSEGEKELKKLGDDGWELASVTPWIDDGDTLELFYYMKRPQ